LLYFGKAFLQGEGMKSKLNRGLCFDLDGTLINSGPGGLAQLCKTAKNLNLPMGNEIETKLRAMWGQHPSNLIRTAWPDTDIEWFYKQWEDLDIAEPFFDFPGTKEALEKLFHYFQLGILTSRNIRTAIPQLEHNNLLSYFGFVLAADSSPFKKPHPKSIDPILNWILKKDLIFVGDTVEGDWKLAQAVGIEFFAVLSGGMDNREKFLAAGVPEDHIIDSVANLPSILIRN
jgi:HAD superfamily hydrolase (TIGR01549 family)